MVNVLSDSRSCESCYATHASFYTGRLRASGWRRLVTAVLYNNLKGESKETIETKITESLFVLRSKYIGEEMQKKLFVLLSALILASLVLSACGTPAPTEAPATQAPATEAPATVQGRTGGKEFELHINNLNVA